MAPLLVSVAERRGVVGGICAGTLALARAGLFRDRAHTSNGRGWILGHVPGYAGAERYCDVSHAVADGLLVSAPGSAPGYLCDRLPRGALSGAEGADRAQSSPANTALEARRRLQLKYCPEIVIT